MLPLILKDDPAWIQGHEQEVLHFHPLAQGRACAMNVKVKSMEM